MPENRFKTDAFRAAVQEVVAAHLRDVTHIPSPDKLLELTIEAAQAAYEETFAEDDVKPAKELENVPFTEFAKLTVLVPIKQYDGLKDYPLLSDNFLAEPFFRQFPTIAAVRGFLEDNKIGLDDLSGIRYEGQTRGVRYDRRAELAQLVHRTGLELLPGMYPFMPMGKGSEAWDRENLRNVLRQVASPQTRDMINSLLREGEDDINYLYEHTPITRDLIRKHLKLGESHALLDNAVAFRNTGAQVAAHLRFLLDFRHISLRGGRPYIMPFRASGRVQKLPMIDTKL